MDTAPSAILAEIYLQSIKCNNIYDILLKHNIIGYFRYTDDMQLIYNNKLIDTNLTLHEFGNIHPKLLFTMKHEQDNKINFLNITIQRTQNNLTHSIYQKATTTDTVIHNSSCHLIQHKMSAINIPYEKGRKEHRNRYNKTHFTTKSIPNKQFTSRR
jgi:hypothetical protein